MRPFQGLPCLIFAIAIMSVCIVGCGVKGDPLPPESPVELGRGKPSYIRATEGMNYPGLSPINREKNQSEEEEEDETR